jgi:hypothetical protein
VITFGDKLFEEASLDILKTRKIEDLHEVGETDSFWINMRRSTQRIELVSKQTGRLIATLTLDDAQAYGLSIRQIDAARGVLKL